MPATRAICLRPAPVAAIMMAPLILLKLRVCLPSALQFGLEVYRRAGHHSAIFTAIFPANLFFLLFPWNLANERQKLIGGAERSGAAVQDTSPAEQRPICFYEIPIKRLIRAHHLRREGRSDAPDTGCSGSSQLMLFACHSK